MLIMDSTQTANENANENLNDDMLPDDGEGLPKEPEPEPEPRDDDDEPESRDDPRAQAMAAVVESRQRIEDEERETHRRDMIAQGLLPPDEDKGKGSAPQPADPDDEQRQLQAGRVIDDVENTHVKIKIDGEERTVALADIVRTAQKHEAADARLQEATRLLEAARAQAAAAQPQGTPDTLQTDPEQSTTDSAEKSRKDREQRAKEIIAAMFSGDEDNAAHILADLLHNDGLPQQGAAVPQQADPEQIAAQVEESLARRSALRDFATAYPEVLKDQDLAALADMKLARRVSQGEPFAHALMQVGAELYAKTGLSNDATAATADTTVTPTQKERAERKRQADFVHSRSASTANTQEKPESAGDIVQGMMNQRARGRWQPAT